MTGTKISVFDNWRQKGEKAAMSEDFVFSLLSALSDRSAVKERGPLFAATAALLDGRTLEEATWEDAIKACGVDEDNATFQELHMVADFQNALIKAFFAGLTTAGFPTGIFTFLARFE